jgi:hypothetical protein
MLLAVKLDAVDGRLVCSATAPVILGSRALSAAGGLLKAVYTVPGVEPTTSTARAYLLPATS